MWVLWWHCCHNHSSCMHIAAAIFWRLRKRKSTFISRAAYVCFTVENELLYHGLRVHHQNICTQNVNKKIVSVLPMMMLVYSTIKSNVNSRERIHINNRWACIDQLTNVMINSVYISTSSWRLFNKQEQLWYTQYLQNVKSTFVILQFYHLFTMVILSVSWIKSLSLHVCLYLKFSHTLDTVCTCMHLRVLCLFSTHKTKHKPCM